jgi:hypothetical protein
MHLEDEKKNHDKMVDAFANSMVVITEKDFLPICKSIHKIMNDSPAVI